MFGLPPLLTSSIQIDLQFPVGGSVDFAGPDGTKKFVLVVGCLALLLPIYG